MVFRHDVQDWLNRYPRTAVLIILAGDIDEDTGEIVYAAGDGSGSRHDSIQRVCI
jgi:hypothetical protein